MVEGSNVLTSQEKHWQHSFGLPDIFLFQQSMRSKIWEPPPKIMWTLRRVMQWELFFIKHHSKSSNTKREKKGWGREENETDDGSVQGGSNQKSMARSNQDLNQDTEYKLKESNACKIPNLQDWQLIEHTRLQAEPQV